MGGAGGVKQRIMVNSADSTYHYIRDRHIGAVGIWLNEQAKSFHSGYKGSKVLFGTSNLLTLTPKALALCHHVIKIPFRS